MNEGLQPFELQREALAERLKLRDQWEAQVKALNETGVLEILPEAQDIGVIGIDGKEYPIPKYNEILSQITPEKMEILEKKLEQGFSKLLMVPMAMPLDVLIDRYKRELLKHASEGKLLSADNTPLDLNPEDPLYAWDQYKKADIEGRLVYYPKQFDKTNHQGQTKQELIDQGDGWEVRLIEDIDIPAQGQGQTIGERKQLEANHTSIEYLKATQEDIQYQEEQGLTPEGWLTKAISRLHETNQQIDDYQGKGKLCYMFGSYFPAVSRVPRGYFNRHGRQAGLDRDDPDNRGSNCGACSSVKI